jgi:PPM family protein phosphatase
MIWPRRNGAPPRFAAHTDVGPVRQQNEDAYGAFGPSDGLPVGHHLFVVADGMGGHVGGQEASALAVETVSEVFFQSSAAPEERLRDALIQANERVWDRARRDRGTETMGTTCTVLWFSDGRAYLGHVGDSRAYRVERGKLKQLTRDHTLVEELRRNGTLTEAEARVHPRRNALTRALGIAPEVDVDVRPLGPLKRGDRFLLCSDGIAPITPAEIASVLKNQDPDAACRTLVARAAEAGSTDNATALAVYV